MELTAFGWAAAPLVLIAFTSVQAPIAPQAVRCASDAPYAGPPRRAAPAEVWRRDFTRAIDGELAPELRRVLDRTLDEILARAPAASVAVAIPGQGLWSAARGLARARPPRDIEPNARFQAASATKTLTAAVVLQLVGDGLLQLDDTVARWHPGVPNASVTTIDDLLRHTSGLVSFNVLPALGAAYRSPAETIALASGERTQFCPGTNWAYTNTGYAMLGQIIEAVEQKSLAEVFASRLFRPLGLSHSALRQPSDGLTVVTGHASGAPVEVQDDYATAYAAGSIASTAGDLVRFWHALLGGRILPTGVVRSMFEDMAAMSPGGESFYGAGVQLYDIPNGPGSMLGHSGGMPGFTSVVAYVAADDLYVAVMLNDKNVPAEAGLWAIVRAVRAFRSGGN